MDSSDAEARGLSTAPAVKLSGGSRPLFPTGPSESKNGTISSPGNAGRPCRAWRSWPSPIVSRLDRAAAAANPSRCLWRPHRQSQHHAGPQPTWSLSAFRPIRCRCLPQMVSPILVSIVTAHPCGIIVAWGRPCISPCRMEGVAMEPTQLFRNKRFSTKPAWKPC